MARTVLVVDDDPLVLEVTADMLKDLGCEVVTAASGMDALERLSENANVDVLITDLNMPGMDGYELAQRAAATRPGLQVIMLSGREIDGRGWPVVRKPFLEEDLAHTMKQTTGALLGAAAARALDGDGEPRAFGAELHNAAQRSRPVGINPPRRGRSGRSNVP